jgi:hypothetical protein
MNFNKCYKILNMGILIGIIILFWVMYVMGCVFQKDLKDMEKTHPKFRKHLKDKYEL